MTIPDLRPAFPHAVPISSYVNAPRHLQLCDPEFFEGCGYATADEAGILYATAHKLGGDWLELGSHTGWTGAHILAGGAKTYVGLDPEYSRACFNVTKDPVLFARRAYANLRRAAPDRMNRVTLIGNESHKSIPAWLNEGRLFDFIFIDANHDAPYPVVDAILSDLCLKPNGAIFLHDAIGAPVQAAVEYLQSKGYETSYYDTAQIMAVAVKGDVELPLFTPSTSFDWLAHFQTHVLSTDKEMLKLQINQAKQLVSTLL